MSSTVTRLLATGAVAAAASLIATGCGSGDDKPARPAAPPAAATTPPAASVPTGIAGTYDRRVTSADIKRTAATRNESGNAQEAPEPGPVRLVIGSSGAMRFLDMGVSPPFAIDQNVSATADRLAIDGYAHPEKGSFCGPEIAQNASYGLKLDAGILTLKALDDPCADRDSLLTGAWKRRA
jgi:hypothetical protein